MRLHINTEDNTELLEDLMVLLEKYDINLEEKDE